MEELTPKDLCCIAQHNKALFEAYKDAQDAAWIIGNSCYDCKYGPECGGNWWDMLNKIGRITGIRVNPQTFPPKDFKTWFRRVMRNIFHTKYCGYNCITRWVKWRDILELWRRPKKTK